MIHLILVRVVHPKEANDVGHLNFKFIIASPTHFCLPKLLNPSLPLSFSLPLSHSHSPYSSGQRKNIFSCDIRLFILISNHDMNSIPVTFLSPCLSHDLKSLSVSQRERVWRQRKSKISKIIEEMKDIEWIKNITTRQNME